MKVYLYFLWLRKGGFAAEGPFVDSDAAKAAREAHRFTADKYDIVEVELPAKVWYFN